MTIQISFRNCIDSANSVLKNQRRVESEQGLYHNTNKFKHKYYYEILNYISEHVTLLNLMDSLGNENHAISIVGYWILTKTTIKHWC